MHDATSPTITQTLERSRSRAGVRWPCLPDWLPDYGPDFADRELVHTPTPPPSWRFDSTTLAMFIALGVLTFQLVACSPTTASGPAADARDSRSVERTGPQSTRRVELTAEPAGISARGGETDPVLDAQPTGNTPFARGGDGSASADLSVPRRRSGGGWPATRPAPTRGPDGFDTPVDPVALASDLLASGHAVRLVIDETTTGEMHAESSDRSARESGSKLTTDSAELASTFDATGGGVSLGPIAGFGGGAAVGAGSTAISAEIHSNFHPLHGVGAALLIASGLVFWLSRSVRGAVALASLGMVLIVLGTVSLSSPWLMGLAFVAMVVAGGYAAWRFAVAERAEKALEAVVPAIESFDGPGVVKDIKQQIARGAGSAAGVVKSAVTRVKRRQKGAAR